MWVCNDPVNGLEAWYAELPALSAAKLQIMLCFEGPLANPLLAAFDSACNFSLHNVMKVSVPHYISLLTCWTR